MLDLLGDELSAEIAAVVRAHVDACDACSRDRARLAAASRLARELPREAPSPVVRQAVLSRARASAVAAQARQSPSTAATTNEESGVARFLRWVSGFVLGPQVAMAMVLLLMVGVGLFYLPGMRRDRAVEGGAIVNADPGDQVGPSATIQPAAPLDLRLDTRTNRLQPAEEGVAAAEVSPRVAVDEVAPADDAPAAAAAIETSPSATLVAGAVTEAPPVVAEAEQADPEAPAGRPAPVARPVAAAPAVDVSERFAMAPAAEERADEDVTQRAPSRFMDSPAPAGTGRAPAAPSAASLEDAVVATRRERSVEAAGPPSPARASAFGGSAAMRGSAPPPSAPSASPGVMAGALSTTSTAAPRTPAALHATARAQAQSGQLRAAIGAYESLLAGHPTYERAPDAMLELAELHRRAGDPANARVWLARAERSPTHAARARAARARIDEVERAPAAASEAAASE